MLSFYSLYIVSLYIVPIWTQRIYPMLFFVVWDYFMRKIEIKKWVFKVKWKQFFIRLVLYTAFLFKSLWQLHNIKYCVEVKLVSLFLFFYTIYILVQLRRGYVYCCCHFVVVCILVAICRAVFSSFSTFHSFDSYECRNINGYRFARFIT